MNNPPAQAFGALRSLLFVPGDSPKKLEKGLGSGADALILDLEDSVAPDQKPRARALTAEFLARVRGEKLRPRLIVRVNPLSSGLTDEDLDAVLAAGPDAILLPKAEGGVSVAHLDAKITACEAVHAIAEGRTLILALATETATALFQAGTYGEASARLCGLTWGAEDLSAALGAESNRDPEGRFTAPYELARTLCVAGAAAAQVPALDTVYVDFRNEAGLRREAEEARRDGFVGKLAIHPAQVAVINAVFTPSPQDIARAEEVVAAFSSQPGAGVVAIGGVMYDRPHLVRAQRLLAAASAGRSASAPLKGS